MSRLVLQVGIACAVFWPLVTYFWEGAVTWSGLQSTVPVTVAFAVFYAVLSVVLYLRRTRPR
jgi:hypothetical protein